MRRHTKSEETAVAMTRELSDDEIGFFKDNGYLLPPACWMTRFVRRRGIECGRRCPTVAA